MTFTHSSVFPAGSSQSAQLTVLVYRLADPVDPGITTNSLVLGIDENDLKEFVDRVLSHPIRVEYTQTTTVPASSLLNNKMINTLSQAGRLRNKEYTKSTFVREYYLNAMKS